MLLTLLDAATKASSMVDIPKIIDKLVEWGINVGKDLIGAILIYIIGRFIIRQISRLVTKILEKRKLEISVQTFLKSLLSILLNLKVGDYIDGQGASGTVKEIQIFHTILSTVDNRIIYVPNGSLSSNAITNYSKQETRRAEWVFGVEYGEDYERVKAVLERIIAADERILQTPAPFIGLGSL